jgi:hypothetical protein
MACISEMTRYRKLARNCYLSYGPKREKRVVTTLCNKFMVGHTPKWSWSLSVVPHSWRHTRETSYDGECAHLGRTRQNFTD